MTTLDAALDDVIDRALADTRIVGAVVQVARDGKLVYSRAAGHADREAGKAMTTDAVFRLSSVTKPIVAATALALVDRGDLALDAPVSRWLPDFRPTLDGELAPDKIRARLRKIQVERTRAQQGLDDTGDQLELDTAADAPTLADAMALAAAHRPPLAALQALADLPGLASQWRTKIINRLAWLKTHANDGST